jgi:2-methylcitrate dehydratase
MKRRLVDSMGCALGGLRGEPVEIARKVAASTHGEPSARVFFTGELTTVDMAAFANGLMVRYLDFNDTYMAREGGHPSDVIAGTLAVADANHLSGREAVLAMIAAFETVCALAESERLSARAIDHSVHVAIGTAVGASRAMRLDFESTANAISMAVVSNVSLKVAREGHLSMWKSGSAANASRSGVFSARLASMGMTAPAEPFAASGGIAGLAGEETTVPTFGGHGQPFHTDRSSIKFFPAQYTVQAPIWAALELRTKLNGQTPDEIVVYTYKTAVTSSADPTKWQVTNRETADHSMPYVVAIALLDGEVTPAQFTSERIADPAVGVLMQRVQVREDESMTKAFPGTQAASIEAWAGGQRYDVLIPSSKGHEKNPASDEDIERKFQMLARDVASKDDADAMLARLWAFDAEADVSEWVKSLVL